MGLPGREKSRGREMREFGSFKILCEVHIAA